MTTPVAATSSRSNDRTFGSGVPGSAAILDAHVRRHVRMAHRLFEKASYARHRERRRIATAGSCLTSTSALQRRPLDGCPAAVQRRSSRFARAKQTGSRVTRLPPPPFTDRGWDLEDDGHIAIAASA